MRRFIAALALTTAAVPALAGVGVSINVGQPGFYGQIDLGDAPRPRLIQPEPVIVQPMPREVVAQPPLYLRVPPAHQQNWDRYCDQYDACGRPVYFVDERWYNEEYVPYYRQRNDEGRRWRHEDDRREWRDEDRRDWRDRERDDDDRDD